MSILSGWVVAIAGTVILIHACEILMPDGEMNRYIKGVLAVICMFVIIQPLPSLLNGDFNFSDLFWGESLPVSSDLGYLDYINAKKAAALSTQMTEELREKGWGEAVVEIRPSRGEEAFGIEGVYCLGVPARDQSAVTAFLREQLGVSADLIVYETVADFSLQANFWLPLPGSSP